MERVYSVYAWSVLAGLFPFIWLWVLIIPKSSWRYTFIHWATRFITRLTGLSAQVKGLQNFPKDKPYIIVSNHCSYIDSVILLAALPHKMRIVAKSELLNSFVTRVFLRRIRMCKYWVKDSSGDIVPSMFNRGHILSLAKISSTKSESTGARFTPLSSSR